MELELSRVDYTIIGITNPHCLQLVPGTLPTDQYKVSVADADGILQVFSVKKDDIQLHFKTLPGPPIISVKVAGATGTAFDKIFVAAGTEVRGYTKKGKLFLTFESGMTEAINTMYVLGNELFLCGKHNYTHYRDCKEVGSCLCGDTIVDVIAFYSQKSRRLVSLIACEGRMIRALEHARITLSMEVDSSPTILYIFEDEDSNKIILFGTTDGRVGILDIENLQGFHRWLIPGKENSCPISCISSHDLNGSGAKQLIIGRQDGNVEVYQLNIHDHLDEPKLIFSYNCNESITGLQCGVVAAPGFDEIVVATYTGRIFGLTTQAVDANVDSTTGGYMLATDSTQKISKLKSDIEELKSKILKEREKYLSSSLSYFDEVSAIPLLAVKDNFALDKESSTYTLSIELPTAIDNILIQCNVSIELLDVEKNSAVVSYSDSNHQEGNFILATYRCQINTNRLELKIRTTEGQRGLLQAYVTPLMQPKCSRVMQYDIKALSLHYRIHQFDSNRPFNVLTMKGAFSPAEIHSWIGQCLPEVPDKPQITDKTTLWFKSNLLGTLLECNYQRGEAEFRSDNISTISTLKENLTDEATKKKIKIDINTVVNDESINFVLKLQEDQLFTYQKEAKNLRITEALQELEITEEETAKYLSEKYKKLLKSENSNNTLKNQTGSLQRLYGTIKELYIDYNKFKGTNPKQKAAKLVDLLDDYSYEKIVNFFRPDFVMSKS